MSVRGDTPPVHWSREGGGAAAPAGRGRVVVIGGGLAGIAAALVAADEGVEPVLLEARPRLGGATTSFQRSFQGGSLWIDTGQHVFMRCCTAYRGLLARLGVTHLTTLQPRLDVEVLIAGSLTRTRLRRTRVPLPAPLHLAPALLGYRALPPADRIRAALAALRIGRLDQRDPKVDGDSFGGWLERHGQSAVATEALWELLTVATLNAPASDASLGLAAKVVRTGLLEGADAGDLGWPEAPLQELHGDAAVRALTAVGGTVRTGTKARAVVRTSTGWEVTLDGGEVLTADGVVLAVPPPAAAGLLPEGTGVDPAKLRALGASPIINVHMIFDRPVLDVPMLAVVGSPVQWIFDRTISSGLAKVGPPGAQYLALSQSAAQEWVDQPANDLRALFVEEMRRLFPAAREAELLEVFVTRERTATFDQAPGSLGLRPDQATGLPGFALAGTWTDTGWPATMEGAVRSGIAAARETLATMAVSGSALSAVEHGPSANRGESLAAVPTQSWDVAGQAPAAPAAPATEPAAGAAGAAEAGTVTAGAAVTDPASTHKVTTQTETSTSTGGFPV
ncbi:squalene-associated FAD-dependent desaturase [Frankia sp. EI5c]|uniref:hydroxysqualene dehydroxylase HpnE n=1 Tax=Frankia sp. EI5c TaxID=683316 RepID=UPI0007C3C352|nr:hydroxysqualene dehydroxylase HpnE [Frankia sp. EI5c]OAA26192.1 squalene-associated FAD-dependent desaturase [Frankia sp. EI5c]